MKSIYPQTDESRIRQVFQRPLINKNKKVIKIRAHHIPCYLFQVTFTGQKGDRAIHVICDGLRGKVRRIHWPQALYSLRGESAEIQMSLDEKNALDRVKREIQWFSFPSGLKIGKKYSLKSVRLLMVIGYPFWIVYFTKNSAYDFSVYDALSGKKENFFGRDIFLELFGLRVKEEEDA
jgi:hypothetical protein